MAEVAGSVAVEVVADTSKYDRGMAGVEAAANKADRGVRRAMDSVKDAVAGIAGAGAIASKSVVGVGAALGVARVAALALGGPIAILAGGAGLLGLVSAAAAAVGEFASMQQEMLTLEAVITTTGGAAGRTASDIAGLADEISNASLATDNMVRSAATQLLTFRSISTDTFDRALKSASDLAAVGFGSIESGAFALGRALENPTEGISRLTRVGITFTVAQKELIKTLVETGRTAEAQRLILDVLEKQVGGAAGAQSAGLSGAFHRLKEATSNWFETLGGGVAKALGLQGSIEGVTDWVNRLNAAMKVNTGQDTFIDRLRAAQVELAKAQAKMNEMADTSKRDLAGGRWVTRTQQELEAFNLELGVTTQKLKDAKALFDGLQQIDLFGKFVASQQAAAAATTALQEKFSGVRTELEKQNELLAMSERGQRQVEAARRAGVEPLSAEGKALAALVTQTDALQRARSRAQQLFSPEALQQFQQSLRTQEQAELASHGIRLEQVQAFHAQGLINATEAYNMAEQERFRHAASMAQIEIQQAEHVSQARNAALQEGSNLLGVFAQKSRAAAIAQIALNKGLAIAGVIQFTTAAAARALFELGVIAGPPAAASIKAWGALQVGLIAATGIAQAAGAGSGGPALSTSTGSSSSSGSSGSSADVGAPSASQSLRIEGLDPAMLYSGQQLEKIIERINVAVQNGTTLISTGNLRT